jgi:hypothetical protein
VYNIYTEDEYITLITQGPSEPAETSTVETNTTVEEEKDGLSPGAIVAIIVSVFLASVAIIFLILKF